MMDHPTRSRAAAEILARCGLFRGLPEPIIERIGQAASRRTFERDESIFAQGDDGDALFCLVAGRVRISALGVSGQEVFLNIMEPGDSFGEIAVVDGLPRTAGATAMETVVALVLQRRKFLNLLRAEPELAVHLLRLFCERIRWTSNLYEETAFLTASARLAKRLLSLATLHGRQVPSGFELKISQSDLARFLGMSRQVVNQYLRAWSGHGWLTVARGRLIVKDPDSLTKIAGEAAGERAERPK